MNLFDRSKFAEDKDLPVTITWDQFKRDVSEVWVVAVKKQRMMQGMGLLTPAMIGEKYQMHPGNCPTSSGLHLSLSCALADYWSRS